MRRTPEYIVFFNATSGAWAVYRWIMNYGAKIQIIICAEICKLDHAHEQMHVHLISRLLGHLKQYFLHHYTRTDVPLPSAQPLSPPKSSANMYWRIWLLTSLSQRQQPTCLTAANVAGSPSRQQLRILATLWVVWDPHLCDFLTQSRVARTITPGTVSGIIFGWNRL